MLTLEKVKHAASVLDGVARKTPLISAPTLTNSCDLYLKCEDLQLTGSFKLRGGYYKISQLSEEEKSHGVIACSAGNHAQGIALAAQRSGTKAVICMPASAPVAKVEATRSYGAEVVLVEGVYDDAARRATELQKEKGYTFAHPFNDVDVMAGQGTIGLEIMEQLKDVDAVVVPIGGGGLISGISFAVKTINPNCKVYGVQSEGAPGMAVSFKNKKITECDAKTIADGIQVKMPGDLTFEMVSKYVDDVGTVSENEIASAMLALAEKSKIVAEGAGATPVAAVLFNKLPVQGKKVVCVVSGGNVDINTYTKVLTRGLTYTGRMAKVTVEMADKSSQLPEILAAVAATGANIIGVTFDRARTQGDVTSCAVELTMETKNFEHIEEIKTALSSKGFQVC